MQDYEALLAYFPTAGATECKYLSKYWLDRKEWSETWKPIKDTVFVPGSRHLPEMMFRDEFELLAFIGGLILAPNDFQALQECMEKIGDSFFVVIQNEHTQPIIVDEGGGELHLPILRFKYPVGITWEELMSGGLISTEVYEILDKEFFIFGDSGAWGKYAATEYMDDSADPSGTPLEIIGFRGEYRLLFKEKFQIQDEAKQQVLQWLPSTYRKRVRW